MAVKSKPGRPPRAQGQAMTRLSVSIQHRYKVALDLIARDQRTSLSQAVEHVITSIAREYALGDSSALAIANQLASLDDSPSGRLQRIGLIPITLLTPDEEFVSKMLIEIGDWSHLEEEAAVLLFDVAADVRSTGGEEGVAVLVWQTACEAWRAGQSSFRVQDEDGFVYEYDLKAIAKKAQNEATVQRSSKGILGALEATAATIIGDNVAQAGRAFGKPNPMPRGPAPKGHKKPSAK